MAHRYGAGPTNDWYGAIARRAGWPGATGGGSGTSWRREADLYEPRRVPAPLFYEPYGKPPNFYSEEVDDHLFRGAQPNLGQLRALRDAKGIASVVSLRKEADGDLKLAPALGLGRLHLQIVDQTPPTQDQIDAFIGFAKDPDNWPVYVHCYAGVGRTGAMVACYRIAMNGWGVEDALNEAWDHGMNVPEQADAVKTFAARLAAHQVPGFPG